MWYITQSSLTLLTFPVHFLDGRFQLLQNAMTTLCEKESRKQYDAWLSSGLCLAYDHWVAMDERAKTVSSFPQTQYGYVPLLKK